MPKVFRAGPTQQVIGKTMQIGLGLKADQIIGAQCLNQIAVIRQHAQQLRRRERRVQEEAERLVLVETAQLAAERDHMIVVNPD